MNSWCTSVGLVLSVNVAAFSQCGNRWIAESSAAGCTDNVFAMARLADGGVLLGGEFTVAGNVVANHIILWDGIRFRGIGGTDGVVYSILIKRDQSIIIGGAFDHAGTTPAAGIARLNQATWEPLDPGIEGNVYALAELPNGDVIAGGELRRIGGVAAGNNVVRWDGSQWHSLGSGLNGRVIALAVMPNGEIVAGMRLYTPSGSESRRMIAKWNGVDWVDLGSGLNSSVWALAPLPNGDFIAGGPFTAAGNLPTKYLARWDGVQWFAMGDQTNPVARSFLPNDDGSVTMIGTRGANVVLTQWNGVNLEPQEVIGAGSGWALARDAEGNLVAGVFRADSTNGPVVHVALKSAQGWHPLVGGTDNAIRHLARIPNGDTVVAGDFTTIFGIPARGIAIRTYTGEWYPMAEGLTGVSSLLVRSSGEIIAARGFAQNYQLQRWNGTAWVSVGPVFNGPIDTLVETPDGQLIAAGSFTHVGEEEFGSIVRLRGDIIESVGADTTMLIDKILVLSSGDMLASGRYRQGIYPLPRFLLRWNGEDWISFGDQEDQVIKLISRIENGHLLGTRPMRGNSTMTELVEWDGHQWNVLGRNVNGSVLTAITMPDGSYVIGGAFNSIEGVIVRNIARFVGGTWAGLGTGTDNAVQAITLLSGNQIAVGGHFVIVDNQASAYFARHFFTMSADFGRNGGSLGGDGELDRNDFIVYIDQFFSANPAADLGSTGGILGSDGLFDNNDFVVFIDLFFQGC